MGKFEKEAAKWFDTIYGEHDQVIAKGDKWMAKKQKELDQLDKSAINFEKEMERHARFIEKWLKENQGKVPKWFSYMD
ncbi:hypothetical protein [Bacillus sp. FJAT-47783]|uniref:hypothetical protein n=1 Tax=Bacillus sp. FJAT-47783 TaxID=2922712 RepID=UPI001FAC7E8A|nr:hypothetical protein [Bacillus sp. FJAT-47783]